MDTAADRALTSPLDPGLPALADDQPALNELFAFMAKAELRFSSLRMRIVDQQITALGEETVTHDVWLRHPGMVKVVSTRGASSDGDYDVWISDGTTVRTFSALGNMTTRRRAPRPPAGMDDPDLPRFSRIYMPRTVLPPESLPDTFVHPNGLCNNVLRSGITTRRGTVALAGGREAILLHCLHPRSSQVLLDRPEHWLEIGVDVQTGMLLLFAEHVGERTTRNAQALNVGLDENIPDSAFTIHVSDDTRTIY